MKWINDWKIKGSIDRKSSENGEKEPKIGLDWQIKGENGEKKAQLENNLIFIIMNLCCLC